ncbi:hypothetical protein DFH27DRAFT_482147 [Peziza echinospora]|nr:hypothetical protein DFH27DRAFT_482147 [Peziza echinospora]
MEAFITEAFTLLGVAITTIGLRTYSRGSSVGWRHLAVDDYLMIAAGIVYGLESGAAYSVGAIFHGLANNGMTDEQRIDIIRGSEEWNMRIGGSKVQLVGWSLYTLLLWLLKLCMAIFYSRLTNGLKNMDVRVRIAFIAIGVTYLATILSILFGCHPFHKNWQINPDPGNVCQPAVSKINLYVTVVLNVVTDLYLMSIPLPLMWKANLAPRRKILLLIMFSGGIFIIMAGILRCALIIADPINGAMQAGSWACRETFVAVIIGNIPMIYPIFMRTVKKINTSVFSSNGLTSTLGKRSGNGTNDVELGGRERPSKPIRRKANPMSIPGLTTLGPSDSEERIIPAEMPDVNNDRGVTPPGKGGRASPKGINVVTEVTSVTHGQSQETLDMTQPHHSHQGFDSEGSPFNRFDPTASGYSVSVAGGEPGSPGHLRHSSIHNSLPNAR